MAQLIALADPFEFRWHPEVWLLVAFLTGAYVYMVRVIGPTAVGPDRAAVTRTNVVAFVAAMVMLWVASDWPLHDISEDYLYSAHMVQHMMLSYFLPPLALMATPAWLMRVLIGDGRLYSMVRWLCRPVAAGLLFNAVVMVTHVPQVVNASVDNGPFHYGLHVLVVTTSLVMWMPVVGPLTELQLKIAPKMIYLFAQTVVPIIPAGWLTFADGAVYDAYDRPARMWGISVVSDQQLAGAVMKLGGTLFLWSIIIFLFFKRFATPYYEEAAQHYGSQAPPVERVGHDDIPLTTADIEREFARVPARPDPD